MDRALIVRAGGRALTGPALLLGLLAASLALGGCSAPPVLAHTWSSDEAVARAVLGAIGRKDTQELIRLSLTRDEFDAVVWPTLPASRPEVGMDSDYVWQDTFNKSRAHLAKTMTELGGRRLDLIRIEFGGATTDNGVYSLSRKTRLVVRDEAGAEQTVRVFGSLIRQNDRSKVYSYIVD